MSELLDQLPEALRLVHADVLPRGARADVGRRGMSAEQVLRCIVVKQMNEWSYEELTFHLADSQSYRSFCRFGIADRAPKKAALKLNIKRVRAETLEAVNQMLVKAAAEVGVEDGRKVRTDCTVEESNIHQPSDSSLLWDCVRVLTRLIVHARELCEVSFTDHTRRAKRRALGIQHASRESRRAELYRDLLRVADKTAQSALRVAGALDQAECGSMQQFALVSGLAAELRLFSERTHRVIDQTRRRVLQGESVPASDKLVSIFEPHTDIICKDRRDTYFGHKLCLTSGASGLVLDAVVLDGNPADSTLAVTMIDRQKQLYGRAPRQASFDGGFASNANLADIKGLGVKDVCFSKTSFLKVTDMVKSSWVYRRLRNFRAGIEAGISFLKRCFGLGRCLWKGLASFKAYSWASIVSHNLLVLARHALS